MFGSVAYRKYDLSKREQSEIFTTYFSVSKPSPLPLKDGKTVTYQHPTSEYWGKAHCQSNILYFA